MLPADWTKTLTALDVLPFSVHNPGPKNILPANGQEIDFFQLIFPDDLYESFKKPTYMHDKNTMKPDHRWIPVEKDEMKAFLGLQILHEYCKFTRDKNVLGKGSSIWKFWNITCP